MWMDEKWALDALWIMVYVLIDFMPGPPIWGGLDAKSIRPWAHKAMIGLNFSIS
jgi:hypothetical protein